VARNAQYLSICDKLRRQDGNVLRDVSNGPKFLQTSADTVCPSVSDFNFVDGNVFERFALMRRWVQGGIPIEKLDDHAQTELHTSDWATDRIAKALFGAIRRRVDADGIVQG